MVKDKQGVLRAGNLISGQEISVDHFVCSTKGRLFSGFNKSSNDGKLYCGGCIFVDHSSSFVHVEFQTSLSSHETLRGKEVFESECRDFGIVVAKYVSGNGTAQGESSRRNRRLSCFFGKNSTYTCILLNSGRFTFNY